MPNLSPEINLVSSHTTRQRQRKEEFGLVVIISCLLSFCLIVVIHQLLLKQIHSYQQQTTLLSQQITKQDNLFSDLQYLQIQKAQLTAQLNTLTILLADREQTKQLFTDLSNSMPAGVYLTNLSRQNQNVTLNGKSITPVQLTLLMLNLNKTTMLNHPQIGSLKSDTTNPPYTDDFEVFLQLKFALPSFTEPTP